MEKTSDKDLVRKYLLKLWVKNKKLDKMQRENTELNLQVMQAEQAQVELKLKCDKLEKQINHITRCLLDTNETNSMLTSEVSHKELETTVMQNKLTHLNREVPELRRLIFELAQDKIRLTQENEDLIHDSQEVIRESQELLNGSEEIRQENIRLRQQLNMFHELAADYEDTFKSRTPSFQNSDIIEVNVVISDSESILVPISSNTSANSLINHVENISYSTDGNF